MIAKLYGKVIDSGDDYLLLDVGGICYEVFIPAAILKKIEQEGINGSIELITYHYHQVEPSKSFPVLIGFINNIEKEFFEQFITVSGIGPKAALKAFSKPISLIAKAIDEGDVSFLRSLPGIGQQRAREIVAKLQGKVGKFALIQDNIEGGAADGKGDISREAMGVLEQLQYKKGEAERMVKAAFERAPQISSVEEILNEVYRQRRK
ncbi:MAG: OB-fold domain-containing protein [Candidatus Omnitrophica bacterium]|nr:OB-fold domain-containing protein [Candidatus Omnitrophota bacterium]